MPKLIIEYNNNLQRPDSFKMYTFNSPAFELFTIFLSLLRLLLCESRSPWVRKRVWRQRPPYPSSCHAAHITATAANCTTSAYIHHGYDTTCVWNDKWQNVWNWYLGWFIGYKVLSMGRISSWTRNRQLEQYTSIKINIFCELFK